jgi:hypothetical protein
MTSPHECFAAMANSSTARGSSTYSKRVIFVVVRALQAGG